MKRTLFLRGGLAAVGLIALVLVGTAMAAPAFGPRKANPGLMFVDFRDVRGGQDGVALMDLNPDSPTFGTIMQRFDIGAGVLPHHLYQRKRESPAPWGG